MTKTKLYKLVVSTVCIWQGLAIFLYILSYDIDTGSSEISFAELEMLSGFTVFALAIVSLGIYALFSSLDD